MNLDNIPQELKNKGLFCTWRLIEKEGRMTKLPFNPVKKQMAKSNDKNTFNNYDTIIKFLPDYYAYDTINNKELGGIGLGIFNGFSAIDIDHCYNPKTDEYNELATDIIKYCASYTELSPSGTGVRIILKTNTELDKNLYYINQQKIGLEIYISDNTNKYVTLTGNRISKETNIKNVDLSYILNKYMKKNNSTVKYVKKSTSYGGKFDERLNKALKYNKKLIKAWNAVPSGSGGDENETDLSLCDHLAIVFKGSYTDIENAFAMSPYYQAKDENHKNKWSVRADYRENTIKNAIQHFKEYEETEKLSFNINDTGNARKLIDTFGDRIRFNVDNKEWMLWNGHFWEEDKLGLIKQFAEITIEGMKQEALMSDESIRQEKLKNVKRTLSSAGKEAMIKEAQHIKGVPVTNNDFDTQDFYFNCKSGLIDLRTGAVLPHDKEILVSKYTDIEISDKKPKLWLKFLNEIFAVHPELIDYVQRICGYALTGYTREQCIFIFLGDGSNGKSLFLDVMSKVLGNYSEKGKIEMLIETKLDKNLDNLMAMLSNVRMTTVSETDLGSKLSEATVKDLTSDYGKITAKFLFKNVFTYKPKFKIFMDTNNRPIIRGTDHGIWRRIKTIPFEVTIPDEKQDRTLGAKLEKELPEILGWCVEGAKKWFKDGLQEPKFLQEEKESYKQDMDVVARWINENCETDRGYSTESKKLYLDFKKYLIDNNEYVFSSTIFGKNMSKKFPRARALGKTVYKGIRIREKSYQELYNETEVPDNI